MITPDSILNIKIKALDPEVIQAVDTLLVEKWTGSSAVITQEEVVNLILSLKGHTDNASQGYRNYKLSLFNRHQLDFEDYYRDLGWEVSFDKPGYNEFYDANWTFKKEDPDSKQALKREIKRLQETINKLMVNT